jgi:RNA recognition motif-containing protein
VNQSFFHHFGEITYCKIPTGKGCGFVQFVRRPDAELAIAKMNDFPIHGKSRIRLSWGRSQGDKQVEHVRKLASALGVPFEAVWRMVQGQENQAMKQQHQQVANSISGNNGAPGPALLGSRFDALGMGRMELGAVATAAGLTEAEVMDLVGGRTESYGPTNGRGDEGFFTRSTIPHDSAAAAAAGAAGASGGPYSRVSPSTFSAFSGNDLTNPISPAPSSGGFAYNQQQPSNGSGPQYAMVNSNSYVQSPVSPYNAVPFVDGAPRSGSYQGYPQQNVNGAHQQAPYEYQQQQERPQTLEGSFENLGFNNVSGSSGPSSVGGGAVPGTGSAPASSVGGQPSEAGAVAGYLNPASAGAGEGLPNAGAQWGAWSGASGARDVQA